MQDPEELGTKIINYEQKEMIPLTDNENKYYEEQKEYFICQKEFCYDKNKKMKFKLYKKVRDHCHCRGEFRGAAHSKECNGTANKSINDLIEKLPNTYQFCNGDLNKFVLLLRKGVYPYEYMDSWERFNETSLPPKKDFYSELTLEDISDKDYNHAQKVFEEYCTDMGDYHDLYVQTDTLLLADVFEKFRDKCIEIYGLDPSYVLYLHLD